MFGSCVGIFLSIWEEYVVSKDSDVLLFCLRTKIGAFLSIIGMVFPFFAIAYRIFFKENKKQLYAELILAQALTIIFGISLALITGIGGPGQKVGDLYYASWFAFVASLGSACSLHEELRKEEVVIDVVCKSSSDEDLKKLHTTNTKYIRMVHLT